MDAGDIAEKGLRALVPPETPPTSARFRYDLAVSLSIVGLAVMTGFHIMWACGWLAAFNLGGGFADADAVTHSEAQLNSSINNLRAAQRNSTQTLMATVISGQILTMYASECSARRAHNDDLAANIADQLSELQVKYMGVSGGIQYPLQPCP